MTVGAFSCKDSHAGLSIPHPLGGGQSSHSCFGALYTPRVWLGAELSSLLEVPAGAAIASLGQEDKGYRGGYPQVEADGRGGPSRTLPGSGGHILHLNPGIGLTLMPIGDVKTA